jgi:tetratricopeptide (TPR) repeat protein
MHPPNLTRINIPGMPSHIWVFAMISSAFSAAVPVLSQDPSTLKDRYAREAVVFEHLETVYKLHADGTGERDLLVRMRVQSDGAAQQFGVMAFPYASAYETPVIKLMRVHKADGTIVDTPASDEVDMATEVSRQAPLYSDLKEKHLPVRSLARGDTLEYEVDTEITNAQAPGQFWGACHQTPPGTVIVLEEVLKLEVPAGKYVQVWSPNHKFTTSESDGLKTYVWKSSQLETAPKPTGDEENKPKPPKDPDEDADGRKLPSVAWTTFHNWQEVGEWYRGLSQAQAKPNAAVKARAEDLTKDAKTPDEQVRAIYSYVSGHTRYVGIDFGIGRYQPHSAADVLANQYGDCKDKDTLLESMLQAKGFSTAPALVGVGIAVVPEVPTPAVFNHVITTVNLPSGRIWLDSTPPAAPYRFLSALIRDQKSLVMPADANPELIGTPTAAPYAFSAKFEANGVLDKDGKMSAKIVSTYHDDDEVIVRALARSIAPAEWDKASQYLSSITGFGGTTSKTQFRNADDPASPIELSYDYSRHPYGDWDNLQIVPLFPALEFSALASDKQEPDDDIQLGAPRTLTAVARIELPEGFRPDLPDPIHVKTDFASFDKTYKFEGNAIIAERTIVVTKIKIPKADWKKFQSFTKGISLNSEQWIRLMAPATRITINGSDSKTTKAVVAKKEGNVTIVGLTPESKEDKTNESGSPGEAVASNLSVAELMESAQRKMKSMDWGGAKHALDQVKTKNPDQRGLWASYGFIAEVSNHDLDEAKADYRKELANQPDNPWVAQRIVAVQVRSGDREGAQTTLQEFLGKHPDNLQIAEQLGSMEATAGNHAGALKTYEDAAAHNPDNRMLLVQEGDELIQLHRTDEGAAAVKSALDGTDDASVLNNAAYVLSKAGTSLDVAEEASRRSIAKLEEESATITTAQVNSKSFADANLLIASWDTLGWILYREGKTDQAEAYLAAAWRAGLRAEIGDHLGQVYEVEGKKDAALTTYILAEAANLPPAPQEVRDHIRERIAKLKGGTPDKPGTTGGGTQALQDLRTYKIAKPQGASGWGTFRLEITSAGVIESQRMSGEQKIDAAKAAIDAMKFPELIPPGSKAHLLRSAVVSCSMGTKCEVVLVPDGGLYTEQQ